MHQMGLFARNKGWESALLAILLVLAIWTRIGHSHRGLPYVHHVDEPHTTVVALEMMKSGDLNPHRFHYGSLNIYMMVAVDALHFLWLSRSPDPVTGEKVRFEEIQPATPDGWRFESSHPSFYLWNRGACSLLGALTALLVFQIGRRKSALVGLVAAATVAGLAEHIRNSAMVAPDVPVGFFALLAVTLATAYMRSGRTLTLIWSFIAVGLALATKYNVAPLLLTPYLAMVLRHPETGRRPHWLWWGGFSITLGTFFVCVPYAFYDIPTFLDHVGFQVAHYSVVGHGPYTVEGGLPHMWRVMEFFASSLTWPGLVAALVGIVISCRSREQAVLYFFPVAYFLSQTQMEVAFHRNSMALYPYLALGLGFALQFLVTKTEQRSAVIKPALVSAAALLLAWVHVVEIGAANEVEAKEETRTIAAREIARLAREKGWQRIGISKYLRIHPRDLAQIEAELEINSVPGLRAIEKELDAIVTPTEYNINTTGEPEPLDRVDRMRRRIPEVEPVWRLEGGPTEMGGLSIDPGVQVFERPFRIRPNAKGKQKD